MQNLPTSWDDGEIPDTTVKAVATVVQEKKKSATPVDHFRGQLTAMESQIVPLLPENISIKKFARVVMTAIQTKPNLLDCDRTSLFMACLESAQDGLLPDGKESALVPRKGKAIYQPMVKGITKKIYQSGDYSTVLTEIVYKEDKFRYWIDSTGPHIEHEPKVFGGGRGEEIGAYVIFKNKLGDLIIEVMDRADIMEIKKVSTAKDGPWQGAFELEMWRKTVLRRGAKRANLTDELQRILSRDDHLNDFSGGDRRKKGLAGDLNGGVRVGGTEGDSVERIGDLGTGQNQSQTATAN